MTERTGNVQSPQGGPQKPTNLWERVRRARAIAAARAKTDRLGRVRPPTWAAIAKTHGITERQARRIYADYCEWQLSQSDPLGTVEESILLREGLLTTLGELADNADNSPARVGAARAMLEVDHSRLELMQAAGRLPRNMARFRAEADFMALARQMVEVLRKRDVPAEVVEELRSLAERHLPQQDNVRELRPAGSS